MSMKRAKSAKGAKGPKHSDAKQKIDAAAIVAHVVQPQVERGDLELFKTPSRVAYVTVRVQQHFETYPLESSEFKDLLAHAIYLSLGLMPTDTLLKRTIRQMKGEALFGPDIVERPVFHRIAEVGGNLYLDLCDSPWRVVEITPTGWWLAKDAPVRFCAFIDFASAARSRVRWEHR